MDEIPVSLALAQAAKETGWGTSRFALREMLFLDNGLILERVLTPAGADQNDQKHKVMKFKVLKASVRAYQRNLKYSL